MGSTSLAPRRAIRPPVIWMRSNTCEATTRASHHAGEAFGLPSIHEALAFCGADRLGHGVRIVDDIGVLPDGTAKLGQPAAILRDKRIPLEMCPSSNVQTGAVESIADHPFDLLRACGSASP